MIFCKKCNLLQESEEHNCFSVADQIDKVRKKIFKIVLEERETKIIKPKNI